MEINIDYNGLPVSLRGPMRRYIEDGVLPGRFTCAALANDLSQAVLSADKGNLASIREICLFIVNQMPFASHGSDENVKRWSKAGGMNKLLEGE